MYAINGAYGKYAVPPSFPAQSPLHYLILLRLISARQFRYNMLNSVEMKKVKEKIEMGDKKRNAKGVSPHLIHTYN